MTTAPSCIRGCGEIVTPLRDAKGELTTHGYHHIEGETKLANVWCPCCGYGWHASDEIVKQALVAYEEWQTKELEMQHGRNPQWRLRTTRDEVAAASKQLPPSAQFVVQTAMNAGAKFGMWRFGQGNLARPAVVATKPSAELEASLTLAGFKRVEGTRDVRYEWGGR